MSRISRRMRFWFTGWPPFCRCQVICRTPWSGVSGNGRTIGCRSAGLTSVSPCGVQQYDDREIGSIRHCAPIDCMGWSRSIIVRLTCRPGA